MKKNIKDKISVFEITGHTRVKHWRKLTDTLIIQWILQMKPCQQYRNWSILKVEHLGKQSQYSIWIQINSKFLPLNKVFTPQQAQNK